MMTKIAVMVSGGGTNLQALLDAQNSGVIRSGTISLVVSNKEGAYALERARNAGVETAVLPKSKEETPAQYGQRLVKLLTDKHIDMVVLAGFMLILDECFIKAYEGRILNVHPSLIPAFCGEGYYGLRVHRAALERGVKVSGATVHIVNEIPDGGPIMAQKAVEVLPDDTPETLQKRVMEQAEWILLPQETEKLAQRLGREKKIMTNLFDYLKERAYPGRGIMLGKTLEGKSVCAYFIMGRSLNSRNRVFETTEDGIRTKAFDESQMVDPSLIIYHPVRRLNGSFIVTNGDQTDTIRDYMAEGKGWLEALQSREFEPDEPNWTPRISGVEFPCGAYMLSILKSQNGNSACCERFFYTYDKPVCGMGHFISTYEGFGSPLPSFHGEPVAVEVPAMSASELAGEIWNALDEDNKVSLYVCVDGDEVILNKNC